MKNDLPRDDWTLRNNQNNSSPLGYATLSYVQVLPSSHLKKDSNDSNDVDQRTWTFCVEVEWNSYSPSFDKQQPHVEVVCHLFGRANPIDNFLLVLDLSLLLPLQLHLMGFLEDIARQSHRSQARNSYLE